MYLIFFFKINILDTLHQEIPFSTISEILRYEHVKKL